MRIDKNPKMINISDKLPDLKNYLRNETQIVSAFLFGSYNTRYQTPLSDLDLALLTKKPTTFQEELDISSVISDILQEEDVNITFLQKTDLPMKYKILSTGRLIFCSDRIFLADFTECVVKLFCDFQIDLKALYSDYDQALREEYLHGR